MTERALRARREYQKAYRMKNKDRIREINERYWDKKGREADGKKDDNK